LWPLELEDNLPKVRRPVQPQSSDSPLIRKQAGRQFAVAAKLPLEVVELMLNARIGVASTALVLCGVWFMVATKDLAGKTHKAPDTDSWARPANILEGPGRRPVASLLRLTTTVWKDDRTSGGWLRTSALVSAAAISIVYVWS
jgi:hypothetical protein